MPLNYFKAWMMLRQAQHDIANTEAYYDFILMILTVSMNINEF